MKMAKNEKTPIQIDGVEYNFEDMSDKQKMLVNHVADLDRKIANAQFNLDQLNVGRQAFANLLAEEVKAVSEEQPVQQPLAIETNTQ